MIELSLVTQPVIPGETSFRAIITDAMNNTLYRGTIDTFDYSNAVSIIARINVATSKFVLFTMDGSMMTQQFNVEIDVELQRDCYNFVFYDIYATVPDITLILGVQPGTDLVTPIAPNSTNFAGILYDPSSSTNEWSTELCCLHPSTMVQTSKGPKQISKILKGETVIDKNGENVTVISNIKQLLKTEKFVKIGKSAFEKDVPCANLLMTPEHTILYGDEEVPCRELLNIENIENILDTPVFTYTLCTKMKRWILCNNTPVSTFSKNELENLRQSKRTIFSEQ